jgi:hypothetical protein
MDNKQKCIAIIALMMALVAIFLSSETGLNGMNGTNGTNGVNGSCATCVNGTNGIDGVNGLNGTNGLDGANGAPGTPGINGINGTFDNTTLDTKVNKSGDVLTGTLYGYPGGGIVNSFDMATSTPWNMCSTDSTTTSCISIYPDFFEMYVMDGTTSDLSIDDASIVLTSPIVKIDAPIKLLNTYQPSGIDMNNNDITNITHAVFRDTTYPYSNLTIDAHGTGHNPVISLNSCCGIHPILYYQFEGIYTAFMSKDYAMSYYTDKPMKFGESGVNYVSMYRNATNKSLIISGNGDTTTVEFKNVTVNMNGFNITNSPSIDIKFNKSGDSLTGAPPSMGLLIGNSITASYGGANGIDYYLLTDSDRLIGTTVYNQAVPGSGITAQMDIFNNDTNKSKYDWIIVMESFHDWDTTQPSSVLIAKYQTMINTINAAKKPSAALIASTQTPSKDYWIGAYGSTIGTIINDQILDLNTAIMGGGATPITGISFRAYKHTNILDDGAGYLSNIYSGLGDGIHVNNLGKVVIASSYRETLNNIGFMKNEIAISPIKQDMDYNNLTNKPTDFNNATIDTKVSKTGDELNYGNNGRLNISSGGTKITTIDSWDVGGSSYQFFTVNRYQSKTNGWQNLAYPAREGATLYIQDSAFNYYTFAANSLSPTFRWALTPFGMTVNNSLVINSLAGVGNDYACLDSTGKLFRSNTAC